MTLLNDLTSPAPDSGAIAPTAASDPLWYKDAIIYQLHVKAFFDADNDGIGDFEGLRRKLDYLQDLGVTTLWLLPFYSVALRDYGSGILRLQKYQSVIRQDGRFQGLHTRGAPARYPGHHRADHQSYFGSAPLVPARA